MISFQLLDVVDLLKDLTERGLRRSDLGTVVQLYEPDALDVEFVTAAGKTVALVTLKASDVRPVASDDLVTVRSAAKSA